MSTLAEFFATIFAYQYISDNINFIMLRIVNFICSVTRYLPSETKHTAFVIENTSILLIDEQKRTPGKIICPFAV